MDLSHEHPLQGHGLLYPLMVIAAVAVIVFSIVGIATITGWMPSAMLGESATVSAEPQTGLAHERDASAPDGPRAGPAFQCAECGVIESIREIERRGAVFGKPVANASRAASGRKPVL